MKNTPLCWMDDLAWSKLQLEFKHLESQATGGVRTSTEEVAQTLLSLIANAQLLLLSTGKLAESEKTPPN
jgi:hypothetical protein